MSFPERKPEEKGLALILILEESSGRVVGASLVSVESEDGCVAWIRANVEYAPVHISLEKLISENVLGRFVNLIAHTVGIWVRRPSLKP